jgi:hypothetical protein
MSLESSPKTGFFSLLRRQSRFFLIAGFAALALRLYWVFRFPTSVDDSHLYANIAENWLRYGTFAITNSGRLMPTLSRLPGYPAFLALIFSIFGMQNFGAVILVQVIFDLGTCLLISDIARRLFSDRAAKAAFLLAALCPFLANYAATVLTETLEIFFTALAFDLALRGLGISEGPNNRKLIWLGCGLAIAGAILLRPDGGFLLIAVGGYLLWLLTRTAAAQNPKGQRKENGRTFQARALISAGLLLSIGAVVPLVPWTIRNLHTLHRFQPLAPRYANDSDEPPMPGFNRWVKTWLAEYVSVEDIYWNVPGDEIDISKLPSRAFDSPAQRSETADLFDDYNRGHDITPEIDARFAAFAAARIHAAPFRYYVWLPALRIVDMWLRPRTELLPADPRWWEFNDNPLWLTASFVFGGINLLYVGAAIAGFIRCRAVKGVGLLLLFVVLRSLFLGTMENPEPRYTLECYPAVIVLASGLFATRRKQTS